MTNAVDGAIILFDRALRSLTGDTQVSSRPCPKPALSNDTKDEMTDSDRKHAAGLMRVNHSGEVCAQALYQGQALTAKLDTVRQDMEDAADEEIDHLAWCEERLKSLDSHPSLLNPLWYSLSFGIGASAGLISDKVSLGFVAATEELVSKHLEKHLENLPQQDDQSKVIVQQMLEDEQSHAHSALEAGALAFPGPVKQGMSLVSKVMTSISYRL